MKLKILKFIESILGLFQYDGEEVLIFENGIPIDSYTKYTKTGLLSKEVYS